MEGSFATFAALLGAVVGGLLSVLASWLAQRVQARSQWLVQEIKQRETLYSEFIDAASCCFADALQASEPDTPPLAKLYAELGRMRLLSSDPVVTEANAIVRKILNTYADPNRTRSEVRELLSDETMNLFSAFATASRRELTDLEPLRRAPR